MAAAQSLPDGVDEARAEITHLYADFLSGDSGASEVSKLFDTTDFGYREIRVERPLKLNFQVDDERVARLHRVGLIELPAPSRGNGNGRGLMQGPDVWPEAEAVAGTVGQLSGLRLEAVQDKPASRLWNGLIERYHFDQEMIGRGRRGRLPGRLLVQVGACRGQAALVSVATWRQVSRQGAHFVSPPPTDHTEIIKPRRKASITCVFMQRS